MLRESYHFCSSYVNHYKVVVLAENYLIQIIILPFAWYKLLKINNLHYIRKLLLYKYLQKYRFTSFGCNRYNTVSSSHDTHKSSIKNLPWRRRNRRESLLRALPRLRDQCRNQSI